MTNNIYSTPAWRKASRYALNRDGRLCQIGLPGCLGTATTADHIMELQDGGAPYDVGNLQAACRPCNTAKRNARVAEKARGDVAAVVYPPARVW